MKKHFFLALALLLSVGVMAQEATETPAKTSPWTMKGNIGLNFGQSSYTNWAAGGQNSLNWQGIFNYEVHYAKNKFLWDNVLNTSLGYNYYDFTKKPIKTDDKIEFTSLAGFKLSQTVNFSAELAFRSQFAKGYDYDHDPDTYISKFLAPAYINLGLGIEWVPNEHLSVYYSPITSRWTIVNDTALIERYLGNSLDQHDEETHAKTEKVHYEFGSRLTAKFNYPLAKNIDFNSKLELFSNYLKNPQYIDVDWQNMLVMKVNSWLNCNLATHLIYDYDIPFYNDYGDLIVGSKVQFKEVLSIGILFNL